MRETTKIWIKIVEYAVLRYIATGHILTPLRVFSIFKDVFPDKSPPAPSTPYSSLFSFSFSPLNKPLIIAGECGSMYDP